MLFPFMLYQNSKQEADVAGRKGDTNRALSMYLLPSVSM